MKVKEYVEKLGIQDVELLVSKLGRLVVFEAGTDNIVLFCSKEQTLLLDKSGELGSEEYMKALGDYRIGHLSDYPDRVFATSKSDGRTSARF